MKEASDMQRATYSFLTLTRICGECEILAPQPSWTSDGHIHLGCSIGRKDDQVTLSNGEKINPGPIGE